MTHTPGPWYVDKYGGRFGSKNVRGSNGWLVAELPRDATGSIQKANARLIAASPTMFEVLEDMAAGSCCQTPGCNIEDPMCDTMQARFAIEGIKP